MCLKKTESYAYIRNEFNSSRIRKKLPKKRWIQAQAYITQSAAKPERTTATTTIREVWNTKIHRFDFKSIDFST